MTTNRTPLCLAGAALVLAGCVCSGFALAAAGHADPGQIGWQEPVTEVARDIQNFHNDILMPIISAITLFVLGLLVYVAVKFNAKANPVPSKTTHNALLEVAWTVIPVMILVVIAIPSFKLLTKEVVIPSPDVTVKATGQQWYWTYDYAADQGGPFQVESRMKEAAEIKPEEGDILQLSVDNEAVVPVNKVVRLQVTADPTGVIHSFIIQSFGVRMDAVPGRLNETWFKAEKEGMYYGQCSKLCGKDHAFMPIAFRVVSEEKYAAWIAEHKPKTALNGLRSTSVAGAFAATSAE